MRCVLLVFALSACAPAVTGEEVDQQALHSAVDAYWHAHGEVPVRCCRRATNSKVRPTSLEEIMDICDANGGCVSLGGTPHVIWVLEDRGAEDHELRHVLEFCGQGNRTHDAGAFRISEVGLRAAECGTE